VLLALSERRRHRAIPFATGHVLEKIADREAAAAA
jgi:hypothetical protein